MFRRHLVQAWPLRSEFAKCCNLLQTVASTLLWLIASYISICILYRVGFVKTLCRAIG
jgi:hypothetical protein